MRIFNFLITGYFIVIIGLFFFSFTQVDLGLTLTEWSIWQVFQKFFQTIGYFNRPFATGWYVTLLFFLSIFYAVFLFLAHKKTITNSQSYIVVGVTSFILFFAYNAFSYDLFNYIFDAKIYTYYHQNPYEHNALEYNGDPMLGFMHWTHRKYPYGLTWLAATIPLSYLGLGVLLPTIMLFKSIAFASYLGTAWYIKKILQKISPQNQLFGLLFFSLNPLVMVEALVSAHNDIFMLFLAVWSLYLLLEKKYIFSLLIIALSIGVKFATVFLLPVYFVVGFYSFKGKKIRWDLVFLACVISMVVAVLAASIRTNFQPWYLLYVLPFTALLAKKYFVLIPGIIISLFALFEYIPFFYLGNWDPPVPTLLSTIRLVGIGLSIFLAVMWFLRNRFFVKS